jgi:hypothetical protein
VFEHVVLALCSDYLKSDDLQFGFRQGVGCDDAIFMLRATVEYFNSKGGTVHMAALDLRKAFDSVNHDKLFCSLKKNGLPDLLINIIQNWYSNLTVKVRWGSSLSAPFFIFNGTRQGSVLSPSLFNVFVNLFIVNLRHSNLGCCMVGSYVGCLLYADDMILLCPSIKGLQSMLDICDQTANDLLLQFNVSKSFCISVGKLAGSVVTDMRLGSRDISWVKSIKYLGLVINGGRRLNFDIGRTKQNFFIACNCIMSQVKSLDEIMQLTLQESYCLPVLTYGIAAAYYTKKQLDDLNACWNTVYRKIFGFNRWESVKCFINGLGRLDFHHLILIRRLRFFWRLLHSTCPILNNIFWTFARLNKFNDYLQVSFVSLGLLLHNVHVDFNSICAV